MQVVRMMMIAKMVVMAVAVTIREAYRSVWTFAGAEAGGQT